MKRKHAKRSSAINKKEKRIVPFSRMTPMDLKKALSKMPIQEFCRLHKSSKWVHQFQEKNMSNTLIASNCTLQIRLFLRSSNDLHLAVYFCNGRHQMFLKEFTWSTNSASFTASQNQHHMEGLRRMVSSIKSRLLVRDLTILTSSLRGIVPEELQHSCVNNFVDFLLDCGVRVQTIVHDGVRLEVDAYHKLKLMELKIEIRDSTDVSRLLEIVRLVQKIQSEDSPKAVNVFLKGQLENNLQQLFPLSFFPLIYEVPQNTNLAASERTIRWFVWPAVKYMTLLRVCWIISKKGAFETLTTIICKNCTSPEEVTRMFTHPSDEERVVMEEIVGKHFGTV